MVNDVDEKLIVKLFVFIHFHKILELIFVDFGIFFELAAHFVNDVFGDDSVTVLGDVFFFVYFFRYQVGVLLELFVNLFPTVQGMAPNSR